VRLLTEAGYEETGQVGEAYDPVRHDAIDGRAVDGKAMVTKVHTRGLTSYGDVVVRAKVEISPAHSPA
jgi:molecular chaperone GrpE (heat shock protein)